jgi:DNA-binding NarL/FixJ family response regulator
MYIDATAIDAYDEDLQGGAASMGPIRVVLADDHAVVRKGIREFLEEEGDIHVIGEASDGAAVKDLILTLQPDVAILDIRMPHLTGIDVTRWIRSQGLPVHILILTAYDDDPVVTAVLQAGANGYVMKDADADEIIAAVRAVHHGQTALDPAVARKLIAHTAATAAPQTAPIEPLSERELAVLELAARGLTNRGIGLQLAISDRTVQGHLANIYAKLQVGSRTEAVTKAIQLGMFHLPNSGG